MKREIIKIDEEKCNGCGNCIPNCHEGALQIVDGKARLISDLMCDGLGACIGHCPMDAIKLEEREAEPYDEVIVIKEMIQKGKNTVIAHLKHLKDHNEHTFIKQAMAFLTEKQETLPFDLNEIVINVFDNNSNNSQNTNSCGGGCPGSKSIELKPIFNKSVNTNSQSELRQWPVQMHLINPNASYYKNSDILIAADCTAYSMGDFHTKLLKGKSLAIACPKLDRGQDVYEDKIVKLINESTVNTITVAIMEVPCCGGLIRLVQNAVRKAKRKVPVKFIKISVEGEILNEEWI
ncbi:MAG: 4Fe-4S binding protein [Marinifilaceae bacterium]|jgi:NAD-dependent dihydropyrimidine dehydrogenase PreA subunit|nr:4Fe-4S binding protein [Marinifilaceae bacterium]